MALDEPRAVLRELPLDRAVVAVMPTVDRNEVPDLPDRVIAATAQLYEAPLISRDRQIRMTEARREQREMDVRLPDVPHLLRATLASLTSRLA